MPIVRPVDVQSAPADVRQAYHEVAAYAAGGLEGVRPKTSPLLGSLAHYPPLLHQHVRELTTVMTDGALPWRAKETLAVAYSMANGCRYCTTNHSATLQARFGFTDAMLVELAAVVAHTAGVMRYAVLARAGVVTPVESRLLKEVETALGEVPIWYRALAADPPSFAAAWEREQALMAAPGLDLQTKALVGLPVAAALGDQDGAEWYARQARRRGCTGEHIGECARVVLLFGRVNLFTIGLQLEPALPQT